MINGSDASFENRRIIKKYTTTCSVEKVTGIESGKQYKVNNNTIKIKVENNSTLNTYS